MKLIAIIAIGFAFGLSACDEPYDQKIRDLDAAQDSCLKGAKVNADGCYLYAGSDRAAINACASTNFAEINTCGAIRRTAGEQIPCGWNERRLHWADHSGSFCLNSANVAKALQTGSVTE
jgi:hypothetical protein